MRFRRETFDAARTEDAPKPERDKGLTIDGRSWDRATLDASGDGYTVLRAVREAGLIVDWEVIDANALVRERWADVVGDVIGERGSRLNAAADNSQFAAVYEAALETNQRQTYEFDLALPNGKGGWRRLTVAPLDADTVSVVTRDISRERDLETALERERKRHHVPGPVARDGVIDLRPEGRFASRTAAALFLGSGVAAFVNSFLGDLQHVDVRALRLTGIVSSLFALLVVAMPWDRHYRLVTNGLVVSAIALLVGSDSFTYYSRSPAATAVYPVFFIVLVAWAGLVREQGRATGAALLCAPALLWMLSSGANTSIGWQCVIVTMPVAAVLGEVLSWNAHRARTMTSIEMQRRLHDPLTGLANRTLLSIQLDHALARARRGHGALAVYFIDVDRFKHVNDTLGHNGGDELLIEMASRLRSVMRESDTVARVGGDEFVVLCEDLTSVRDATEIAQRLLDAAKAPQGPSGSYDSVTISIGIAYSDMGMEGSEELLQNADLALYRAKQEGRARFEVFGETLRHQVAARRELEHALRQGIPRGELRAHFQPIIDTGTGRIASFEALVRWERPGYGLVPPVQFIGVAEETGLILDLGAWILMDAFERAAEWAARWPDRRIGVSVNLSACQLASANLIDLFGHALATTGLDPRLVTFEITESTVIERSAHVEPQLHRIRELGANLAIDDFGTGYSSLTYLRRLPINIVKIDRSFIRAIGTEREDAAIVDAIISLSRHLGLEVIAEGVESAEQLATLVHLNCNRVQGFLFSQPRPADELAQLFDNEPFTLATSATAHALERPLPGETVSTPNRVMCRPELLRGTADGVADAPSKSA